MIRRDQEGVCGCLLSVAECRNIGVIQGRRRPAALVVQQSGEAPELSIRCGPVRTMLYACLPCNSPTEPSAAEMGWGINGR